MTQEALKMALAALETYHGYMEPLLTVFGGPRVPAEQSTTWKVEQAITAIKEALRENAMREVQRLGQEIEQECWCTTCRPITMADMRFVVCPDCGNKRCPKANDHRNACTNSNEVGQEGSSWEHVKPLAQPEQEPLFKKIIDQHQGLAEELKAMDATEQEPVRIMGFNCLCGRRMDVSAEQGVVPAPQHIWERPWVSLTNKEKAEVADISDSFEDVVNAVEAKLKEKNEAL